MKKAATLFALTLMATLAVAQNTVGNCNTNAVIVANPDKRLFAFTFEPDRCLGETEAATLNTPQGTFNVFRDKRMGNATLYKIENPAGLKSEMCNGGGLKGDTIKTPLGPMVISKLGEKVVRSNGCVIAMQFVKGLYMNANEINLFANPFLNAVYTISDYKCTASNVCGIGLVTAAHCLQIGMGKEYAFTDRRGNATRHKAAKWDEKLDYAIFPQLPGICLKVAKTKPRKGEIMYVLTKGKGGIKIITVTHQGHIKGSGWTTKNNKEILFDMSTSYGDSGSGMVNSIGEFIGIAISLLKDIGVAGMRQAEDIK